MIPRYAQDSRRFSGRARARAVPSSAVVTRDDDDDDAGLHGDDGIKKKLLRVLLFHPKNLTILCYRIVYKRGTYTTFCWMIIPAQNKRKQFRLFCADDTVFVHEGIQKYTY